MVCALHLVMDMDHYLLRRTCIRAYHASLSIRERKTDSWARKKGENSADRKCLYVNSPSYRSPSTSTKKSPVPSAISGRTWGNYALSHILFERFPFIHYPFNTLVTSAYGGTRIRTVTDATISCPTVIDRTYNRNIQALVT